MKIIGKNKKQESIMDDDYELFCIFELEQQDSKSKQANVTKACKEYLTYLHPINDNSNNNQTKEH